jgi:hypothetical protein
MAPRLSFSSIFMQDSGLNSALTMKIFIESNFVIEGLGVVVTLDFDQSEMTMREFIDKLSQLTAHRYELIDPESHQINTEDWRIEINGRPFQVFGEGLDVFLKDGDTVGIMILPIGGG